MCSDIDMEQDYTDDSVFSRSCMLLGSEVMKKLTSEKVIIFGVGGVGSWCAESLVRSGLKHLTLVDSDVVCPSNINRQLMATTLTIGQVKVDALKNRLLEINPQAEITAIHECYTEETSQMFDLNSYDYVIDAIDSLANKAFLIINACQSSCRLFSSMGAALRLDSSKVSVSEFWNVKGDPLAASLRRRFKKSGLFPPKKFKCVYSTEQPIRMSNIAESTEDNTKHAAKRVNGSLPHVTGVFGFTLAGLVIKSMSESYV